MLCDRAKRLTPDRMVEHPPLLGEDGVTRCTRWCAGQVAHVLDDLPVPLGHEVAASEDRFTIENPDPPVVVALQESLRQDELRVFEELLATLAVFVGGRELEELEIRVRRFAKTWFGFGLGLPSKPFLYVNFGFKP